MQRRNYTEVGFGPDKLYKSCLRRYRYCIGSVLLKVTQSSFTKQKQDFAWVKCVMVFASPFICRGSFGNWSNSTQQFHIEPLDQDDASVRSYPTPHYHSCIIIHAFMYNISHCFHRVFTVYFFTYSWSSLMLSIRSTSLKRTDRVALLMITMWIHQTPWNLRTKN
jgi:hypothetical protein